MSGKDCHKALTARSGVVGGTVDDPLVRRTGTGLGRLQGWSSWGLMWLVGWGWLGCAEVPLDNPYDPAAPEERWARGAVAVRLALAPDDRIRPAEVGDTLRVVIARVQTTHELPWSHELQTPLAQLSGGAVVLEQPDLLPGTEQHPRWYQLRIRDDYQLFAPIELPIHAVDIGQRWTAAAELTRRRLTISGSLDWPAGRAARIRVTLIGAQPTLDCGAVSQVIPEVQARERARQLRQGGETDEAGPVEGPLHDEAHDLYRVTLAHREFLFEDVPRVAPQLCLLVEADGCAAYAQPVTLPNDEASLVRSDLRVPLITLQPIADGWRVWNLDTLADCTRGTGACRLDAVTPTGDTHTRRRLVLLQAPPAVWQDGADVDSPVALRIAEQGPRSGQAPEDGASSVVSPQFCLLPGAADCSWGGGRAEGHQPNWRVLTREQLTAAELDGFCPSHLAAPWSSVWGQLGRRPVPRPADLTDPAEAEGTAAPELDGGRTEGDPGSSDPPGLQLALRQLAAAQPDSLFLLYCLAAAGSGAHQLQVTSQGARGLMTTTSVPSIILDPDPPYQLEAKLLRPESGALLGTTLYLRKDQVVLAIDAADGLAQPGELTTYWWLEPDVQHASRDRAAQLQECCITPAAQPLSRLGDVSFDLFRRDLAPACAQRSCEGSYLFQLVTRDPADNETRLTLPLLHDATKPIDGPILSIAPQSPDCPALTQAGGLSSADLPIEDEAIDVECQVEQYLAHGAARTPDKPGQLLVPAAQGDPRTDVYEYAVDWDRLESTPPALTLRYPYEADQVLDLPLNNLSPGSHTLRYWLWDRAGNLHSREAGSVVIDLTPPTPRAGAWLTVATREEHCPGGDCPLPTPQDQPDWVIRGQDPSPLGLTLSGLQPDFATGAPYLCARLTTRWQDRSREPVVQVRSLTADGLLRYQPPATNPDQERELRLDVVVVDRACNLGSLDTPLRFRQDTRPPRGEVSLTVEAGNQPLSPQQIRRQSYETLEQEQVFVAGPDLRYTLRLQLDPDSEQGLEQQVGLFPQLEWMAEDDWPPQYNEQDVESPTCPLCWEGAASCNLLRISGGRSRSCTLPLGGAIAEPPGGRRSLLRLKVIDQVGNRASLKVTSINGVVVADLAVDVEPPSAPQQLARKQIDEQTTQLTWAAAQDCQLARYEVFSWIAPKRRKCKADELPDSATSVPCRLPPIEGTRCQAPACDTALTIPKEHNCFQVRAVDLAGNTRDSERVWFKPPDQ